MSSETFHALLNEAKFTCEMLGAGATQIRKGNYAKKGIYFQAFTSLSTGLERIGKLCLMLDYYVDNRGSFPSFKHLKQNIGHDLELLYSKSQDIVENRKFSLNNLNSLDSEIHNNILKLLSSFAKGDRYSNINILVNSKQQSDPLLDWFENVDLLLFNNKITLKKKSTIEHNAAVAQQLLGGIASIQHSSEAGDEIDTIFDGSYRTGIYEAVAPYRQLNVLQIIRYWVELLCELEIEAMSLGNEDIPFFSEIFTHFYNSDSYFSTRKTWDKR